MTTYFFLNIALLFQHNPYQLQNLQDSWVGILFYTLEKICSSILESSRAIFFKGMQNWSAPNVNRQFLQSACPRCCTGRLLLCLSLQSQSADMAVWIREWTLSLLLSPLGHQGTWLFSQSPSLCCSFSASSSSYHLLREFRRECAARGQPSWEHQRLTMQYPEKNWATWRHH